MMIWDCMTAKVIGEMILIDGTINVCDYSKIMTDKMTPSLQKLKEEEYLSLKTINSTKLHEFLQKKKKKAIN